MKAIPTCSIKLNQTGVNMRNVFTFVLFAVAIVLGSGCTTVEPGYVGVVKTMGEVREDISLVPGWHLLIPVVHEATHVSLQGLTLTDTVEEDSADAASVIFETTPQTIGYTASVTYTIEGADAAIGLVSHYGFQTRGEDLLAEQHIRPAFRSAIKQALTGYTLIEFASNQQAVAQRALGLAQDYINQRLSLIPPNSVRFQSANIVNFDYPDRLEQAFADTIASKQAVEIAEQHLEEQRVNLRAQVVAAEEARKALVEQANGESEAMSIRSTAMRLQREQEALGYTALRNAGVDPELVIRARTMELISDKWNGQVPATFAPADGSSNIFRMFNFN